ncbi:MAG: hypothetical protein RR620_08630 [Clostridium sp.]
MGIESDTNLESTILYDLEENEIDVKESNFYDIDAYNLASNKNSNSYASSQSLTYTLRYMYTFVCNNDTFSNLLSTLALKGISISMINTSIVELAKEPQNSKIKMCLGKDNFDTNTIKDKFEQLLRNYGISFGRKSCIQIVTGGTDKVMANLYKILSPTTIVEDLEYGTNNSIFIRCKDIKLADRLVSCFATRI